MIKIAIAEDNNFLATSLINKPGLFDEFKVKFHAMDGEDLLAQLVADSNIDVILMDIQMPVMDGINATAEVSKLYPHIKVIMLTVLDTEQTIYEAIQAGAIGYLVKESNPKQIYDSIQGTMSGGAAMSPEIAAKAFRIMRNPDLVSEEKMDFGLSDREHDVLAQLSKGLNYNQIATNLIISPNTVRRHIENIYKKLEVHNKTEAVQVAYKNKLV